MIEYFEKNLKSLTERGVDVTSPLNNFTIKYNMLIDGYYHKFFAGNLIYRFLQQEDMSKLITSINKMGNNLIVQYETWPDLGGVYLKCKKVDFVYQLNTVELINKFDNTDAYLDYVIKNVLDFSREIYPCYFNDWNSWNVAIQEDLSWIVIDLDDMFQWNRVRITDQDFINELVYKTARKDGGLDTKYVEDYIRQHFVDNPNDLNFLERGKQ